MEIKKIRSIKKYKSFRDYSWHPFLNTEELHSKTNIVYGENGSGKSSICNILKSVSQQKEFVRYFPEEVELTIGGTLYKYSSKTWTNTLPKGSILFFDREFVEQNVHLGRDRGTQQGAQEQHSGRLIIEFDTEAIRLRSLRDKLGKIQHEKDLKVNEYQRENNKALAFELLGDDEALFKKYKTKNSGALGEAKQLLSEKRTNLENDIKNDKQLLQKANVIQEIEEIEVAFDDVYISTQNVYQKVFNFDLKEQVKAEAQNDLVEKIREHKEFFERGFDIRRKHLKKCPFCQSENQEAEIKKILDTYNQLYDDSYKKQKTVFENNKRQLVNELECLQAIVKGLNVSTVFIALKRLAEKYSIKNLYSVEEEAGFQEKIESANIDELKKRLLALTKPNKEDISDAYRKARTESDALNDLIKNIETLVIRKNRVIHKFQKENTNSKLSERIAKTEGLLGIVKSELEFIQSSKLEKQNLKIEKLKDVEKFKRALEKAKEQQKAVRVQYEEYCSTEAFAKTLTKIESYFNRFNFSFKLQLDTANRQTSSTKELPFAFKVIDFDGNERDLKEGLSEGEVQVLSLCFFFAFLDIQGNKAEKILVFDDPITSLDDSNLSSLVDLISEEREKFSQTLILTHHRTFFKFLRKKFSGKCSEYSILRNKNLLGGSFICKSQEERFVPRLKDFEAHLIQVAQNPNGFDTELKIVEYGQYLRYEIEYFIKCRLLHWNVSSVFTEVIDGIKENKKVSDNDLDKVKQIYSFCNWTTSHVDVGDDHGMAQLKEKITDFVLISDKY